VKKLFSSKSFNKLVDSLLREELEPAEIQECPNCGGRLKIGFTLYASKGRMLGIRLKCEDCKINMALDRGEPIPNWLKNKYSQK
jgi:hypothetical protein